MITLVSLGVAIILFLIFAAIIGVAIFFFNQSPYIDVKIKNYVNIFIGVVLLVGALLLLLQLLQGAELTSLLK